MCCMRPYLKKPEKGAIGISAEVRMPATKHDDLGSILGRPVWWESGLLKIVL